MPRSPAVGLSIPERFSNYATTPYPGSIGLTSAFDCQMRVRCLGGSGATQCLMVRWASPNRTMLARFGASISLNLSPDGTTSFSTASANFVAGIGAPYVGWLRWTWRASDGALKFYSSVDGDEPTWVQLGATTSIVTGGPLYAGGSDLWTIGGASGLLPLDGSIFRAIIRDGYDGAGSVVFDADFSRQQPGAASFTEGSPNAATVSILSSAQPPAAAIVGRAGA